MSSSGGSGGSSIIPSEDQILSVYGANLTESGQSNPFSTVFITLSIIGAGLSYFIATVWSNVFTAALDEYKQRQLAQGKLPTNQVWLNLILACVATLFSVAMIYLMISAYTRYTQKGFKIL